MNTPVRFFCFFAIFLALCQPSRAADPQQSLHFLTESLPPFTYELNGEAAGPMRDILNEACARLHLECQSNILPWRRSLLLAEKGEAEGIYSIVDIPERQSAFHVLRPTLFFHYAFFERSATPAPYAGLASLRGRVLAAYGPSATARALSETAAPYRPSDILTETDNLTVLRKLAAERYGPNGIVLINEDVATWLMKTYGLTGLRPAARLRTMAYTFGLSRATVPPELAARFNETLLQLCREGVLARIAEHYQLTAAPCY